VDLKRVVVWGAVIVLLFIAWRAWQGRKTV
jgi:hypothetical protein